MIDLIAKQRSEETFHDQWASSIEVDGLLINESFQAPTAIENKYILKQIPCLTGKKILDLGCGAGEAAVYFALQGAEVYAVDISQEMLNKVSIVAQKHNVVVKTFKSVAEKLDFDDNTFDYVYGNGVLHHTSIKEAGMEVCRVLRDGGKAFFIEPLSYNPLIELYRRIARTVRTQYETPFRCSDLRLMKKIFRRVDHKEFWFFSLYLFIHFFLFRRIDPAKARYWKLVIEEGDRYRVLFSALKFLDDIILSIIPPLRWLCWNTVLILEK